MKLNLKKWVPYGLDKNLYNIFNKNWGINIKKMPLFLKKNHYLAHKKFSLNFSINNDLKKKEKKNISFLKEIGSYVGSRHKKFLPCRGQRTHTNASKRKKVFKKKKNSSKF